MGKIIKYTDLSGEEPGARANLEDLTLQAKSPVLGKLTIRAQTTSGSSLNSAICTAALALTGCACAGTIFMIGAPVWAAAFAILLPAVIYYVAFARRRRRA
jgi:Flp pilus assembly protein TadB